MPRQKSITNSTTRRIASLAVLAGIALPWTPYLPVPERRDAIRDLRSVSRAFAEIASRVRPTVVSVHSIKIVRDVPDSRSGDARSSRTRSGPRRAERYRQHGSGSGVVISPDGYIITNVHVVNMAESITVTMTDNRQYPAKLVGADRLSEIAVLKVDAANLDFAELGDSDSCRVGEWVVAVGNPLDLTSTVTAGIISATARRVDIIDHNYALESFLQTDAAINPGNSGGALVDVTGKVIGINTAIATETGYDMGFGFAIPINLVRRIAGDLIRHGVVNRAYAGFAMRNINALEARALGLERPAGVLVDDVFAGGPAEAAGIEPLDVLVRVDGKRVNRANEVQELLAKRYPDQRVDAEIVRRGSLLRKTMTLGRRLEPKPPIVPKVSTRKYASFGIRVKPLAKFDRIELEYSGNHGVLVSAVERGSPAEKAGIQIDDILVELNRQPLHKPDDFRKSCRELQPGSVAIFRIARSSAILHHFVEVDSAGG